MGDPLSEVAALEKEIMKYLDDPFNGSCANKTLTKLDEFSKKRPTPISKPDKPAPQEGEEAQDDDVCEYDETEDQIREMIETALGGVTVDEAEEIVNGFFTHADVAWRQHSLKIRQVLAAESFDKERAAALQRNKDLRDEIKKWRKKAGYIMQAAYEAQEIFKLAASGKPIPAGGAKGADAIWAEVFQSQENQKEKAKEALAMMEAMNAQADDCAATAAAQTEQFKENIGKAQDVTEGLKDAMGKLNQLSGGFCSPILGALNCVSVVCVVLVLLIVSGTW